MDDTSVSHRVRKYPEQLTSKTSEPAQPERDGKNAQEKLAADEYR